jgi:hypothetical protein
LSGLPLVQTIESIRAKEKQENVEILLSAPFDRFDAAGQPSL